MRKVALDQSQADLFDGKPKKWQIVSTEVPSVRVRYHMWFKWLRQREHAWNVKQTQWVLRHEKGEIGERPHFHFLIRGLKQGVTNRHFRFQAMTEWENLGGGIARIRRFDDSQNGVGYVLKNLGANAYELGKFELDDIESVRMSPALVDALASRQAR